MNFNNFLKDSLSLFKEKKQKIMIIILFLIIIIIIFVVYFGISNSSKYNSPSNSVSEENRLYLLDKTINEISFDVNFLDYLEDLNIYGVRPSGEIEKGTTNPF
ncbi:MAG: hypothetical protein ABIG88_00315 [Patescibacteria group bacterium]|nr:hypothetical protein [Patescibacteria group bacterium]